MGRSLLGVLAGAIAGFIVVMLVEWISLLLFPLPAGVDPTNQADIAAAIPSMPVGAFLMVMLAWVLGAGVGAVAALRLAGGATRWPGLAVGGLVLAAALYNLAVIPHPAWFAVSSVLAIIAVTHFATRARPTAKE